MKFTLTEKLGKDSLIDPIPLQVFLYTNNSPFYFSTQENPLPLLPSALITRSQFTKAFMLVSSFGLIAHLLGS